MLPKKQLEEIKKELDECSNPVFLYDNDCDGLCSFLILYKYKGEGKGYRHQKHTTDERELENIQRMGLDKLFILDVPASKITQEFVDKIGVPVIHIEHHFTKEPLKRAKTFNPSLLDKKDDIPTSTICYNAVKRNLWLCAVGTVADWHLSKETTEFAKKNKNLLNPKIKDPAEAMFKSKIGLLGRIFNFILKGDSTNVRKTVSFLMKVEKPEDILEQKSKEGKEVFKHYEYINREYESLVKRAEKSATKEKVLIFEYEASDTSFSAELSNELLYKYPKKIILIARKKGDDPDSDVRCSIRSGTIEIRSKLQKALEGVEGHGGGHAKACGALIKEKDFDKFIEQFKDQL